MNPLLLSPALDLVSKVLDRVIPDKAQAEKAKAEYALLVAKQGQDEVDSFRKFVVQYEGEGASVSPPLQFLRGSVRPVLTYILAGLYGWGFLHPGTFTPDGMQGLFQLNLISLGFWYGERALSNLGLNLSKT
jgi:hypothetical protein